MISIAPNDVVPRLRHANYIDVGRGQYWGFRKIPDFELVLIVKGQFEYQTGDNSRNLAVNDILCIPPDTEHKLTAIGRTNLISCIHFDLLKADCSQNEVCRPEPYPALVTQTKGPEFFHLLFREIAGDFQKFTTPQYQNSCQVFKALWVKLSEYWQSSQVPQLSPKIQAMLDYIKRNVLYGVDRHTLAEHFGYSPEYINYLFKTELSLTPTQLINREKIFIAFEMIQNQQGSIGDIAEKLGFYDQYHFSKVFKQTVGNSPIHYKKKR